MTPVFQPAKPLLRIFDEAAALKFHTDDQGFTVDWEHRFAADLPLYIQISRWGLVLHLTGHFGAASPGATVFIPMTGVRDFHASLSAANHPHSSPGLVDQDRGPEMTITDRFGNRIRFCEMD